MTSIDEFQAQMAGTLIAIRMVLAALVKTHPDPEQLLQEMDALMKAQIALNGHWPDEIETAFNEQVQEFAAHLRARIDC